MICIGGSRRCLCREGNADGPEQPGVRGLPRGGAGAVLPKSTLWSPERYYRADSKAGAAAIPLLLLRPEFLCAPRKYVNSHEQVLNHIHCCSKFFGCMRLDLVRCYITHKSEAMQNIRTGLGNHFFGNKSIDFSLQVTLL